jgi:hypothetical protein
MEQVFLSYRIKVFLETRYQRWRRIHMRTGIWEERSIRRCMRVMPQGGYRRDTQNRFTIKEKREGAADPRAAKDVQRGKNRFMAARAKDVQRGRNRFMAARAEGGRRAGNLCMRAEAGNLHTAGREGGPETAEKDPAYRTEKECSAGS